MHLRAVTGFHAVGQGCFYSGRIMDDQHRLRFCFVYDCGNDGDRKLIRSEVVAFHRTLPRRRIDLLVLSHLHADHTNGIGYLLPDGRGTNQPKVDVDTAILPYVPLVDRLIIALRDEDPKSSPAYYDFLSDPAAFLLACGVGRIVFITRGDGEHGRKDENNQDPDKPPFRPPKEENDFPEKDLPPANIDTTGLPEDPRARSDYLQSEGEEGTAQIGSLEFREHRGYVCVDRYWLFKFFNHSFGRGKQSANDWSDKLEMFQECVEAILGDFNPATLKKAIRDKKLRSKLKTCYSQLVSDHNKVSLLVWHGPSGTPQVINNLYSNDVAQIFSFEFAPFGFYRFEHSCQRSGAFLTGDVDLNYQLPEVLTHFGALLKDLAVVLVPHHGSSLSWNPAILGAINDGSLWVIAAGLGNRYRHPDMGVLDDLAFEFPGKLLARNHERSYVRLLSDLKW